MAELVNIEDRGAIFGGHWGYVNFKRTRVGFSKGTRGLQPHQVEIWASRPEGYHPTPTVEEFREAAEVLRSLGIVDSLDDIFVRGDNNKVPVLQVTSVEP